MLTRWFWVVSVWYVFHFPATSPADVYRQFLRRCWDVVRNFETSSVHLRLRRQVRITVFPGWYQLIWYLRNSSYIFRIFPDRISNYSNCCFEFTRLTCGFVGWFCSKWDWFCCARSVAKGCLGDVFPIRFLCKVCICMYDVSRMIESVQ